MKCRKLGNWAMALCATAMGGAAQADTVSIDGIINANEILGATVATIGNGGGTAYFRADGDYIYGAFDITGWTSAMGAASQGNLLGFGVWALNNGYGGDGVEFQQSTTQAAWGGDGNSGTMNGLVSAFRLDAQTPPAASIPGNLQAFDSFATGHRVWEVLMSTSTMTIVDNTLWAVGGINFAGQQHWYGAPWANPNPASYIQIQIPQGPGSPLTPTVVPIPGAAGLGLLGMSLVGYLRRRKAA